MGRKTALENFAADIKGIACRYGARIPRVFGSFARGDNTASSDLDLLVDFEPGRDLLDLIGLKQELEQYLGISVGVFTEQGISPYLRSRHSSIPWQQVAGLRDVLVHQYFGVNLEMVWEVVENRLPELGEQVQRIIETEVK